MGVLPHTLFMEEPSADYHLCDIRCQAIHSLGPLSSNTIEWISTVEQCGLLGILCHTGGSLQEGLLALKKTRVDPLRQQISHHFSYNCQLWHIDLPLSSTNLL